MKKGIKSLTFLVIIVFLIGLLFTYFCSKVNLKNEYLHITTVAYRNGVNYDDGVSMVTYIYDVRTREIQELINIPIDAVYPISYYDDKEHKLYYSNAKEGEGFDNLYEYDLKNNISTQLTDGKFLFNDFMMIDRNLICNVAPRYATVTQPAIYNIKENVFRYLNQKDDDTWCHSLSYHKSSDKLLSLTCSDSEMRTYEIAAVTYIRPKTLYLMNPDFTEYEPIYFTKEFEVRVTRQLDNERIMLAVDPTMGSAAARKLKILDVNTKEVTDLDIPELKDMQSFHVRDNAEGIFILGKDYDRHISIYHYDMIDSTLTDIFATFEFPPEYCGIVDFIYSYN